MDTCCWPKCAREQCRLDQVWFLPASIPPHKQGHVLSPVEQRIEMLELAVAGNPAMIVSRLEADRGGVTYTVDTLAALRAEDPGRELLFLMGADSLADLPNCASPRGFASWRFRPSCAGRGRPSTIRGWPNWCRPSGWS